MKSAYSEIEGFLKELKNSGRLPPRSKWWPSFVFHFSDMCNIAEILRERRLWSRNTLIRNKRLFVDAADDEIIAHTELKDKQWVRLYFRPKTPTSYRNEGIRPKAAIQNGAHCPVPVYLLFDAVGVLGSEGTCFTDGSLARKPRIGNDIKFLRSLDFGKIYHDTRITEEDDKPGIINARHSEVLFPEPMGLEFLQYIVCRSPAERETLLHLLGSEVAEIWRPKIILEGRFELFQKKFNFLQRVDLGESSFLFRFYPDSEEKNRGPFDLYVWLRNEETNAVLEYRQEVFYVQNFFQIQLPNPVERYTLEVRLDGILAYRNLFQKADNSIVF